MGVVVLNKSNYINICLKHLNNERVYLKFNSSIDCELFLNFSIFCFIQLLYFPPITLKKDWELNNFIKWIFADISNFTIPPFHCLIKIHKMERLDIKLATGRPIVGNYNAPFGNASKFIAFTLQPILERSRTFLKNSFSLIEILSNLKYNGNYPIYMLAGDVIDMYPSVPLNDVRFLIMDLFDEINNNDFLSKEQYLGILEFVLFNVFL